MPIFRSIADGLREAKAADISGLTFTELLGGASSKSGVAVNADQALRTTTVLACARVLANGIAQPPLQLYRDDGKAGKTVATDHPYYQLLHRRPNDWMTSYEFRQTMMLHAVLGKGGFAYKNRVKGKVVELLPLRSDCTVVKQGTDWTLTYEVSDSRGLIGTFGPQDLLRIRGMSWDGYTGLDIVALAREAIGLALATEETHARLHSNGVRPGGLLSVDATLSPEARAKIKAALQEREGLGNAFKTLVLDKGADFKPFAVNGVDSQHIETRKFQIEEICRAMGVFPQMIGYADKTATFASAEAFFQAHVTHSIQPWAENWDQALDRDLDLSKEGLFAKLDLRGLLRGDFKTRTEGYARALGSGGHQPWMTVDEVRDLEDLDPIAGGDVLPPPAGGQTGDKNAAS
ncbi:MAG: phage portal protein [Caulobacter sp.]|nr:phage portal protein [Caulobacter sp.]